MSRLHIANFQEAPRESAIAASALGLGEVVKLQAGAVAGTRYALRVTAAADVQAPGLWGVVMKVKADPTQVAVSTAPVNLGDRTVTIASGDLVTVIGMGAILEYHQALLHDSLNPDNSGATPLVGHSLGVSTTGSTAKWSTAATTSLTNVGVTIHVGRVFRTFAKKVLIKIVAA